MQKKKNVYLACSMIKSKKIDFSLLEYLINWIEKQGFHTFAPGKMEDAHPKIIFERDIKWLKQSSIIIADVNEPSHGVGMEIMYAYEHSIPVICLINRKNRPLSRMVEGCPITRIIEYDSEENLKEKMEKIRLEAI